MIYLTSWDVCPVGCGMGMLFLKARGSGKLFLYCPSCEIGIDRPPEDTEKKRIAFDVPDVLAPEGIAVPTREEIEAVGWDDRIATEALESEYESSLWRLWAITHIECRVYKRAIDILDQVIATWHVPPTSAFTLRDEALRLQATEGTAAK